jgi:hypothetical protein
MTVFLISAAVVFALLLAVTLYYLLRMRIYQRSWDELLARLVMVDRGGIAKVALDAIDPSGRRRRDEQARELTPEQIWNLLGGVDGVEILEKNSHVLVEIAMHLRKWYPEAAEAAEMLRRQATELGGNVENLRMADAKGHLEFHFASYAQNATIGYYLMTQQLLELYRESKLSPRFTDLGKVI